MKDLIAPINFAENDVLGVGVFKLIIHSMPKLQVVINLICQSEGFERIL